jgi:hypothetical protein
MLNIQQNTKALNLKAQYTANITAPWWNMSAINTLCAKFVSVNTSRAVIGWHMLTSLLPSVMKNSKWQRTWVKRCRSKPPSFSPGRPTCHGVYLSVPLELLACSEQRKAGWTTSRGSMIGHRYCLFKQQGKVLLTLILCRLEVNLNLI